MSTTSAPRNHKKPAVKSAFKKDDRKTLLVCHKPCDECLFSKNKIVSDGTKGLVLDDCERNDRGFICHKHSIRATALKGTEKSKAKRTYCHGYWTRFHGAHLLFKLADALGLVRFVDFKGEEVERVEDSLAAD